MKIRRAKRSDIATVAQLWVHTFPGERSHAERMYDLESGGTYGGIETVDVAEEGGELAAALKLYPLTQHIGGCALPMMGLAAVGVAPWARRRGIAAQLCRHALRAARGRGDVVSVLYPFRPDFYRRLGWATVGELHVYRFRTDALAMPSSATPVRLATTTDEVAIAACYLRVAESSNGLIGRGERIWRRHLGAPGTHAFVHHGDGVRGYMIVRYGRARSPEQRTLFVRELVAEDDGVYADLLGWIPLQRDLWRVARYDAAPDEHFWMRLRDPRPPGYHGTRWLWDPVARVIRAPMLRILNVHEAFTRRRDWGRAPPLSFILDIVDAELPENGGRYAVTFDGTTATIRSDSNTAKKPARTKAASGNVAATPVSAGGDAAAPPSQTSGTAATCLATDVGTLAQLFVGEIGVQTAVRMGLARAEGDLDALEALFRPRSSFRLLDEF